MKCIYGLPAWQHLLPRLAQAPEITQWGRVSASAAQSFCCSLGRLLIPTQAPWQDWCSECSPPPHPALPPAQLQISREEFSLMQFYLPRENLYGPHQGFQQHQGSNLNANADKARLPLKTNCTIQKESFFLKCGKRDPKQNWTAWYNAQIWFRFLSQEGLEAATYLSY